MSNVFNIQRMAGQITAAKDKAGAMAAAYTAALAGHVLPPLPFPYTGSGDVVSGADGEYNADVITTGSGDNPSYTIFGTPMCFPLSIKLSNGNDDWWLLPTEPIITLGGGNIVAKSNVAKSKLRGSIKERWSTDDYTISIEGLLTRFDQWTYPQDDVARLRAIVEARDTIDVKCQLFEIFGIGKIVVEKYDWPFTKGEENQAYRLSVVSDDDWDLLIKK